MIIEHQNKKPSIHPSSFIAPNATICGEVKIGENCRIMHGAQLIAENSPISIGDNCIVLQNAVLRGAKAFPLQIGNNCLIGPNAHLASCTIGNGVFIATGASVFHKARLEDGAKVRINAVVHANSLLTKNSMLPIAWVAAGNPATLLSPDRHEEIWKLQKELQFMRTVYGIENPIKDQVEQVRRICSTMSQRLSSHQKDQTIQPSQ